MQSSKMTFLCLKQTKASIALLSSEVMGNTKRFIRANSIRHDGLAGYFCNRPRGSSLGCLRSCTLDYCAYRTPEIGRIVQQCKSKRYMRQVNYRGRDSALEYYTEETSVPINIRPRNRVWLTEEQNSRNEMNRRREQEKCLT